MARTSHATLLPHILRSPRRLEVLQTNRQVVVHVHQLTKAQPTWFWVHLQGVPRKAHEGWLQRAESADRGSYVHFEKPRMASAQYATVAAS
jgi:hypothetical protein